MSTASASMTASLTASRRERIRRLLRSQVVPTQEELKRRLAKEGFEVTQATLSRDLARIGARRVALPSGGTAYELKDLPVSSPTESFSELLDLVQSIDDNGTLVVMHTSAGAASAVAAAIDQARLPEVLGTLAGDDTIFLAPSRGTPSRSTARRLTQIFSKGSVRE